MVHKVLNIYFLIENLIKSKLMFLRQLGHVFDIVGKPSIVVRK
jgi:hypothetical protein